MQKVILTSEEIQNAYALIKSGNLESQTIGLDALHNGGIETATIVDWWWENMPPSLSIDGGDVYLHSQNTVAGANFRFWWEFPDRRHNWTWMLLFRLEYERPTFHVSRWRLYEKRAKCEGSAMYCPQPRFLAEWSPDTYINRTPHNGSVLSSSKLRSSIREHFGVAVWAHLDMFWQNKNRIYTQ